MKTGKTNGSNVGGQSRRSADRTGNRSMSRVATACFALGPVRSRARVLINPGLNPGAGNAGGLLSGPDQPNKAKLLMAVPKRLLRRAVDRNAVRRAARQAWADRIRIGASGSTDALLRMTALPEGFGQASRPQRKKIWRCEMELLMDRYLGTPDDF